MAKLTELAVRNARIPIGSTKTEMLLSDGDGLNLLIRNPNNRKTWLFRYTRLGGTHKLHIGAYPSVSLAVAREAANDLRRLLRQGLDPIEERQRCPADFIISGSLVSYFSCLQAKPASQVDVPWGHYEATILPNQERPRLPAMWSKIAREKTLSRYRCRIARNADTASAANYQNSSLASFCKKCTH